MLSENQPGALFRSLHQGADGAELVLQTATQRVHAQIGIAGSQRSHVARQNTGAVLDVGKRRSGSRHGDGDRLGQTLRLHQCLAGRRQLLVGVACFAQHPCRQHHQHQHRATQQGKQGALMLGSRGRTKNRQAHQFVRATGLLDAEDGRCPLHAIERSVVHILYDRVSHHAAITTDGSRDGLASEQLIYFLCKGHSAVSRNLKHECSKIWRFETGTAISAPASGGRSHRYGRLRRNSGNAQAQARPWKTRLRHAGPADDRPAGPR